MDFSDITDTDLQDEIIASIINKEYRKQVTKRMKDGQYMLILSPYVNFIFQDFESFLRTEVDLVEDDIGLVLNEDNSSFITYELQPSFYTFNIFQKPFSTFFNLNINYITTQLILNMMTLP